MVRNSRSPLVYLVLAVLILLGVDFILANLGIIDSILAIPYISSTHQVWTWFDAILLSLLLWIPIFFGLYRIIHQSKERRTAIEDLCKHLKRMGLDATVESKWSKDENARDGNLLGSVKIVNRNIDLMELWWERWGGGSGEDNYPQNEYRCHYVVKAKMDGLVESQPIIKGLSRETVDFKWEGKELAQVLNSDANLRKLFLSKGLKSFLHVEIIPYGEHKCIIRQKFATYSVKKTFPTTETFETLDRIAHHIRSISNVSL